MALSRSFLKVFVSQSFVIMLSVTAPVMANASQWDGPLNGISDQVIANGYQSYARSAALLQESSEALCARPSESALLNTREAFKNNALDWQKVQWLNFGPVTYFMRYYAFEYWPDKKGITQRQLRSMAKADPATMDSEDFWQKASIAVRGLTAIESLLYHPDFSPLTSIQDCHLLANVTEHHALSAMDVNRQWQTGHAEDWVFAADEADLDTKKLALEAFLLQWIEHIGMTKDAKLETPLGYHGNENLKLAEFYRSHLSLQAIQTNLQSYRAIYHAGSPSLFDIAQQSQPELAIQLEKQLTLSLKMALRLPETLLQPDQAHVDQQTSRRDQVQPLVTSLSRSQAYLSQLVTALGFQIGFNGRDGD